MLNTVDPATRTLFKEASSFFPSPISELIYFEKYSRWSDDLGRREVWPETVQRAVDYLRELSEDRLTEEEYREIHQAILGMDVLPSMRLLAMAGAPARRSHITLYNCSYLPVDSIDSFVEALVISMSGTGVGYSVERQHVAKLPVVKPQGGGIPYRHTVQDSAEGWADALRVGLGCWFNGFDVEFDFDYVRLDPESEGRACKRPWSVEGHARLRTDDDPLPPGLPSLDAGLPRHHGQHRPWGRLGRAPPFGHDLVVLLGRPGDEALQRWGFLGACSLAYYC